MHVKNAPISGQVHEWEGVWYRRRLGRLIRFSNQEAARALIIDTLIGQSWDLWALPDAALK